MSVPANPRRPVSAHVIVLGNEKGGSGKSTLARHVAAARMSVGQRVATIDLDSHQKSFTRYVEFRRDWAWLAAADRAAFDLHDRVGPERRRGEEELVGREELLDRERALLDGEANAARRIDRRSPSDSGEDPRPVGSGRPRVSRRWA